MANVRFRHCNVDILRRTVWDPCQYIVRYFILPRRRSSFFIRSIRQLLQCKTTILYQSSHALHPCPRFALKMVYATDVNWREPFSAEFWLWRAFKTIARSIWRIQLQTPSATSFIVSLPPMVLRTLLAWGAFRYNGQVYLMIQRHGWLQVGTWRPTSWAL